MRSPSAPVRAARPLLIGAFGLLFAGCGVVSPDDAAPSNTIGSEEIGAAPALPAQEQEVGVLDAGPTDVSTAWAVGPVGGPVVVPLASAPALQAVVEETHGRTSNVSLEMQRFLPFPELATPARADVFEIRADVRQTDDRSAHTLTAEIGFTAEGTVEELAAFYQRAVADLGWTLTADVDQTSATTPVRRLTYDVPASAYPFEDFVIDIRATGEDAAPGSRPEVRLRYRDEVPASDTELRDRFSGWAQGIPLPPDGELKGAGLHTTTETRQSVHYALTVSYPNTTPEDVAAAVRAELPSESFASIPQTPAGDDTDNWIYLDNEFFSDARITTHGVPDKINPVGTLMNIDARATFNDLS
ncbi:MAG: hypothetical protein AAF467_23660 [Actinomycetota bacterium]